MMKSITILICLLFITTIGRSQDFSPLNTSPGENRLLEDNDTWEPIELQDAMDWREKSIGLFFMPIPLNIDNIAFEFPTFSGDLPYDFNLFSGGVGASLNFDFSASGSGFGNITYFALIFGTSDSDFQAYDIFTALKYDIKLGALSRFELSPLVGLGNLTFRDTVESLNFGSSLYFSGGARITWLAASGLFIGADVQSVPLIFNTQQLLGVEDVVVQTPDGGFEAATDVKIEYSFPVQINLSLRYNIF